MRKLEITLLDMPCQECKGTGKKGFIIKKECAACGGTGKKDRTFSIRDIMMGKVPYLIELSKKFDSIGTDEEAVPAACEAVAEIFGNQFTPQDVNRYFGISQINAFFKAIDDEKNA